MASVQQSFEKVLLIINSLFLSSAGDLKYTVYFSLESVEFYSKCRNLTAAGWVGFVILCSQERHFDFSKFSSAVIIWKLNDFSSIGDRAHHIEEYKEKRITPQGTIRLFGEQ